MKSPNPQHSLAARFLGILAVLGMALSSVQQSSGSTESAGSKQLNPKPDACCDCIKIEVEGGELDGNSPQSPLPPISDKDGNYDVNFTIYVLKKPELDPDDPCEEVEVTSVEVQGESQPDLEAEVELNEVTLSAAEETLYHRKYKGSASIDATQLRECISTWKLQVYCSGIAEDEEGGCTRRFKLSGGCESSCSECDYTAPAQVSNTNGEFIATSHLTNEDGGHSAGYVDVRATNGNFDGTANIVLRGGKEIRNAAQYTPSGRLQKVTLKNATIDIADVAGENACTIIYKDSLGAEFRNTKISKVNEGGFDIMRCDTTHLLTTHRSQQILKGNGETWFEKGKVVGGQFEVMHREILVETNPSPGVKVYRKTLMETSDPKVNPTIAEMSTYSVTETTWEKQLHGWVRTQVVNDPDDEALTTTWTYYQPGELTGPGASTVGLGRLKQMTRYDGYQAFYTYALNYESVTTPYAGDVSGKVVTTQWNPGTRTSTTTTTINGTMTAKEVCIFTNNSMECRDYTSETEFLTTITTYKASRADFGGRAAKVQHPDGTLSTYAYTRDASGGYTSIVANGATSNGSTVSQGMRTTTVANNRGTVIMRQSTAIGYPATGADGQIFGNMAVTDIDELGRALTTAYHADVVGTAGEQGTATNPAWQITRTYDCCGLQSETDKYGITTKYAYDHLRRRIKSNRMDVTMETVYNGLTTSTHRYAEVVGGNLSSDLAGTPQDGVNESTRNLAGTSRTSSSPDPTGAAGDLVNTNSVTTYQPSAGLSMSVLTTAPDGFQQTTESFLDGSAAKTTGALSPEMEYSYSVNGMGEEVTQSYLDGAVAKETTKIQSDWLGRQIKITYLDGAEASKHYNSKGQLVRAVDPDGVVILLGYNNEGERTTTAIDLIPNAGLVYDDEADNIVIGQDQIRFTDTDPALSGGTPVFRTVRKVWDPSNNDAENVTSHSERTPDGLTSKSIQFPTLAGGPTRLDITSETVTALPGGGNWTITTTNPDDTVQIQSYTSGLLTSSVWNDTASAGIASTTYAYDNLNRQTGATDSRTGLVATEYISATADYTKKITDAGGRFATFTYDVRGRRTSVDAPDSGGFDNITNTIYNPDNTVQETNGDKTYRTTHTYDYADRQVSMTTFGTQQATTSWAYSSDRGFLTTKTYDDGNSTIYTYTNAGRLGSRVWDRGITTNYIHDAGGRLTSTDYSDNTPDITITYDTLGRKTQTSNGVAISNFSYSATNLLPIKEVVSYDFVPGGAPEFTRTIDRTQDSLLRLSGFTLKDGATSEHQQTNAYRAADGRLAAVSKVIDPNDPLTNIDFDYTYQADSANLLASIAGPVVTTTKTWEATRNVLDTKTNGVTAGAVSSYDYTVDNYGQRTNVATSGSAFPAALSWAWGYNATGELITADSSDNSYDRAYQYDGIGNREKSIEGTTDINAVGAQTYAANALNQYTTVGAVVPDYDEDGNAIAYPVPADAGRNSDLEWDAENRLIQIDVDGTVTKYDYDSMSRRIRKVTGTNETVYVYDGWNLIAQYETNSYTLEKTFTWGMDLSGTMQGAGGVGGLLAVSEGSNHYYATCDGNGNVSEYIDGAGTTVAHYEYDPFGKIVAETGTMATDFEFRFSTKYTDSETGLLYYGYRYYDPETGRWINRDPIEELGGTNLYGFVSNEPTSWIDRLGLALYAFDGTNNDRERDWDLDEPLEKQRPTNVAILASIYGDGDTDVEYQAGVGTRDGIFNFFGKMSGLGGKKRIKKMFEAYEERQKNGDCRVDIIGFSRGAATARDFANMIVDNDPDAVIHWVGLFDTVSSFGLGGNSVDPGYEFDLPKNVKRAYHLVAAQRARDLESGERRYFFPVTGIGNISNGKYSVNPKWHEAMLVGAHSDIGGGYDLGGSRKNLSNLALKYMRDDGAGHGAPFGAIPKQFSNTKLKGVDVNDSAWPNDKLVEKFTEKTRVRNAYDAQGKPLPNGWATVKW